MEKTYTVYQNATFVITVKAKNKKDAKSVANETPISEWACIGTFKPEAFKGDEFGFYDDNAFYRGDK